MQRHGCSNYSFASYNRWHTMSPLRSAPRLKQRTSGNFAWKWTVAAATPLRERSQVTGLNMHISRQHSCYTVASCKFRKRVLSWFIFLLLLAFSHTIEMRINRRMKTKATFLRILTTTSAGGVLSQTAFFSRSGALFLVCRREWKICSFPQLQRC